MKNLPSLNNGQTMSSTEIAALTGKEKSHVHRDISVQILSNLYGVKANPNLDGIDIKGIFIKKRDNGQISEFLLDRYHADILVSGYDVKYRAAIVKRWHELELQAINQQFNIPKTLPEALRLAADTQEKLEVTEQKLVVAENQIEQQKTLIVQKDEYIAVSNEASIKAGDVKVRTFVKSVDFIDIGEVQFFEWMRKQGIIMKHKEPYQEYVKKGFFTWKPSKKEYGGAYTYTLWITPRGKLWLSQRYLKYLEKQKSPLRNGLVVLTGDMFLGNDSITGGFHA
jgi:anti-repressor protein